MTKHNFPSQVMSLTGYIGDIGDIRDEVSVQEHLLAIAGVLKKLAESIGQSPIQTPGELAEPLTRTERKVLSLMDSHLSYPEIAEYRSVSLNTIKTHRSNIFSKLSVSSRQQAVQRAKDLALL